MIIIGEKINGATPSVADAIVRRDEVFIRDLARRQAEAGADYIDVCAASPDEEVKTLKWLIRLVEEACGLPISIDSPNPRSIAEVLPLCQRPGIVNSVSLGKGKIETLFPLIAGSEWECIALLCGDTVPYSAEDRIGTLDPIMEQAARYGIDFQKIHIDPMIFCACTRPDTFSVYDRTARIVRSRYPEVKITGGLSNVSYGLPSRPTVDQAFLILAMASGMDSVIMDPTDPDLIGSICAAQLLLGQDDLCERYLDAFHKGRFGKEK